MIDYTVINCCIFGWVRFEFGVVCWLLVFLIP